MIRAQARSESARLGALYSLMLLDTPGEERFDRLTRLCARMFDMPMAGIVLIDRERAWAKSLSAGGGSEVRRDESLCALTIEKGDILVIDDLERYEDESVAGVRRNFPHLRFYAGCPLAGPDGHLMGALCVLDTQPRTFSDADQRTLRDFAALCEAELAPPRPALDALAREHFKDQLVAVIGHELRTPVTAIQGALSVLMGSLGAELSPGHQRMLEMASQHTEHLSQLLADVLMLDRLGHGEQALSLVACDARAIAESAAAAQEKALARAGIKLELGALDGRLLADPPALTLALAHLIGNAAKFSPAGSQVWLSTALEPEFVRITVRDEGRGIPSGQLARMFERFVQGDTSDSRDRGGLGLGLALSRGLVEAQGGRLWAESPPGRGCTFTLLIPNAEG